jgi:hypothetical protein
MKTLYGLTIAIATLLTAGCAHTYKLNDGGEQRLAYTEYIGSVHLTPSESNRVEKVKMASLAKNYVETGKIWERAFRGNAYSQAKIKIENSEMIGSAASAGLALRFTYNAKATLTYQGRDYTIIGSGSRAAAMQMESAMRQSVELALKSMIDQVRQIMASASPAPPAS